MAMRRSVGWIGILLPFVLVAGNAFIFRGDAVLPSISRYYHSGMRDVFVGGLCALAFFMFYYSGFDWREDWAGNIAGAFGLGTALFPTVESGPLNGVAVVHSVCAIGLFLTLGVYSFFLFSRVRAPDQAKPARILTHRLCGAGLFLCVAAILAQHFAQSDALDNSTFAFWIEVIALESFGVSWILEGRSLRKAR
jgi:hypothetical protein